MRGTSLCHSGSLSLCDSLRLSPDSADQSGSIAALYHSHCPSVTLSATLALSLPLTLPLWLLSLPLSLPLCLSLNLIHSASLPAQVVSRMGVLLSSQTI